MAAARALGSEIDPVAALPHFGRGRRGAVEAGTALAAAAQSFLDTVDQTISATSQSVDAKQNAVAASLAQIDASLSAIETDLVALSSTTAEPVDAA